MRAIVIALVASASVVLVQARPQVSPFLGAWNMTGVAPDTSYVYWLEITQENGQLSGMFLNRSGNPNPLAEVRVEGDELVFRGGQAGKPAGPTYRARVQDGRLIGQHTLPATSGTTDPAERVVNWVGLRQHEWRMFNANGSHTFGTPVTLFDGASLAAFRGQQGTALRGWSVVDGIAVNEPKADNLVSNDTFFNFSIEAEYRLGPKSNSGIYLRGRYELQVLDDFNDTSTRRDLTHMAIYGRTAPMVKASRPAGEWQQMRAVLVGNRVTVTLNGQRVHDNAPIPGITGGALDANELTPGPIMIQGDHTGVWLRRVVVTPITRFGA